MSTYDRGAFGQLLAEAKELGWPRGVKDLSWKVFFDRPDDDPFRWAAQCHILHGRDAANAEIFTGHGRTGEEALRRLVEKLRASHTVGDGSDPK